MCNHCHLLLEVTPPPKEGMSDESLLKRLGSLDSPAFVATVAKALAKDGEAYVQRIHERFTLERRMIMVVLANFPTDYPDFLLISQKELDRV